ncbi:MAG: four helix bundle protein [Nostoc sp. LLA-1]|nr:four helix bundle protein [Cyanocohniella sp. LLY]
MEKEPIKSHEDLEVYKMAFDVAMKIFELSKKFPVEEKYSLIDQIRRSSRSVCANLAEAWRKCRYEAAFVAKLSDSESEAAETQTWLKFAVTAVPAIMQYGFLPAPILAKLSVLRMYLIAAGSAVNVII